MPGLDRIARRRALLLEEIAGQRALLTQASAALRKDIAFAAMGLAIGRVLVRRPWLRVLALGAVAAFAATRLAVSAADSRSAARPPGTGTR